MNGTLSPLSDLEKVIAERRKKALRRRENLYSLRSILSAVAFFSIAIVLFSVFFGFRIVEGSDMFPSLCDGDLALCYRVRDLKKNDIVFYEVNGERHCGRVVAKGGDRVTVSAGGTFFVNGTVQENEIIYPTYPRGEEEFTETVPEGTVFVLGDFRTEAEDSRDFGFISLEDVDRKIIAIIRHRKF